MPPQKPDKPSDAPAPAPLPAGPDSPKAPDPVSPTPDPEPARDLTADEMLTLLMCPTCGGDLVAYDGDNPHKTGTAFCATCGQRLKVG